MMVDTTTNIEGIYLVYPPFVRSLGCYLRRRHDRNWNHNQNWNLWSRSNTKRSTLSTATGNHPRRSTRSSRMRRGVSYYKKEEY